MPFVPWKKPSAHARQHLLDEVSHPLVEPILHPSPWRIRALGLSTAFGHPLFYAVWTDLIPQPYERLWQRLGVSLLGVLLLTVPALQAQPPGRIATLLLSLIFWLTLPVYFTWMYLCNERNAVWFASMATMFLIYYHLTDWRLATVGTASGILAGIGLFEIAGPQVTQPPGDQVVMHLVVFGFAWYMGLMLGISSSSLRREQIKQALGTMGIMAHELRTPLATMALIGDALLDEARQAPAQATQRVEQLTGRLQATVRHMNRQIDLQIANARLMQLPQTHDIVSAARLVQDAVQTFPYRNAAERACVQVHIASDFSFRTSETLFRQVMQNLLKNALHALASLPDAPQPGDLRVEIHSAPASTRKGRICVIDRGRGIDPELQARLFQPFVSTNQRTGHGLGLAFCQRVVHTSHGRIRVESPAGQGARFIIDLPTV